MNRFASLRYKLFFGFLLAAVLVAIVGYVSHSLNRDIRNRVVKVNNRAIYLMRHVGEMGMSLNKSLMYTREYLENWYRITEETDKRKKKEDAQFEIKQVEERVHKNIKEFHRYLDRSIQISEDIRAISRGDTLANRSMAGDSVKTIHQELLRLRKQFELYESLVRELLKLSENSYKDGEELLTVTIEPFYRNTLMPIVDSIQEHTHQRVNDETGALHAKLDFSANTILVVGILALLICIAIGYGIYRSISGPLHKLTETTQKIGRGKLDERIDIKTNDEIGVLADSFNRMVENLSNTTVSKNYFNNIIQSLGDALAVTDHQYKIQNVNKTLKELTGLTEEELEKRSIFDLFREDERDKVRKRLQKVSEDRNEVLETYLVNADDTEIPVSFTTSTLPSRNGEKGMVCLISDITERKRAEEQIKNSLEEKKVLLAEIHHRVKNNLAVITSLLQMQIYNTKDRQVKNILSDSQLRIQSIALIHEKLYQSDTLAFIEYDRYVEELLSTIEEAYSQAEKDIDLQVDISEISLNINKAIPCSLWLNEVVVNSFKHAFTDQQSGRIEVKMEQRGEEAVKVVVRDNGKGLPDWVDVSDPQTLGITLISTLTKQLEGDLEAYNDEGAVFELTFQIKGNEKG